MTEIPRIDQVAGAIFDVDDTLLDNFPSGPTDGLHERSRRAAIHEVGRRHNIVALQQLTPEANLQAFLDAPVHTVEAAVWNVLLGAGEVAGEQQPEHPLLREIVTLKDTLHEKVLWEHGKEVPDASAFVRALALRGVATAIASTAVRRDIDIFLQKFSLQSPFPDTRIVSKENVTHYKPHPEVFETAFRTLGLDESERAHVLAFEDDPRGIMAAKAAGLYTCAITTRYPREQLARLEAAPDVIADSYQEFADIFDLTLCAT